MSGPRRQLPGALRDAGRVAGGASPCMALHVPRLPSGAGQAGVSPDRRAQTTIFRMRDFFGAGRISGTVSVEGVPASRKVRLFDAMTALLVAETRSGSNGAYRFDFLDLARDYFVLAHDHTGQFNAVIADRVRPEVVDYP